MFKRMTAPALLAAGFLVASLGWWFPPPLPLPPEAVKKIQEKAVTEKWEKWLDESAKRTDKDIDEAEKILDETMPGWRGK